ncbi:CNP1-like family protein [Wielerella bovis]|uniref:CNP1-like family protein n=1 Tax=Wielerella bovis TaxID=2917790 RepID=UPI0020197611|nr:CNP1-like family protein [Wielerella bovis]ULJ61918.1 CNP1-like family protein [Wielerella bovis]
MKKTFLAVVLCAMAMPTFAADSESYFMNEGDRRLWGRDEVEKEFVESVVDLPLVPDARQGDWFEIYVDNMFKGKPQILLSSIKVVPDGSVRYLFNNQSFGGSDNITAEGLHCVTGTKILDSEGSRIKIFAYADTVNQRWIKPRNAQWKILGGQRNSNDRVRRVLYDAFCLNDKQVMTEDELREKIRQQSSKPKFEYGK